MFFDRATNVQPFASTTQVPNYGNGTSQYSQNNIVVSDSWSLSPMLLNEARVSYSLNRYGNLSLINELVRSWQPGYPRRWSAASAPDLHHRLLPGRDVRRQHAAAADASFRPYAELDEGQPQPEDGWVCFQWNQFQETGNWLGAGQVRFTGSFTKNAFADFLLGDPTSSVRNNGLNRDFRSINAGFHSEQLGGHASAFTQPRGPLGS